MARAATRAAELSDAAVTARHRATGTTPTLQVDLYGGEVTDAGLKELARMKGL